MVLNGAYLVDAGRAEEFGDTVRELADRHPATRLALTGPWPPYSFAAVGPPQSRPGRSHRRPDRGIGATLLALEEQMVELREHFGLAPEDLNLDLGPLGPLLPRD